MEKLVKKLRVLLKPKETATAVPLLERAVQPKAEMRGEEIAHRKRIRNTR